MAKLQKSELKTGNIVISLIICAVLSRIFGKLGYSYVTFGLIRTVIYIGLYIAWGISVRKRVIHEQVRRYLTTVSVMDFSLLNMYEFFRKKKRIHVKQ